MEAPNPTPAHVCPGLQQLRCCPPASLCLEQVFKALQDCLCLRFAIEERQETDFYRLAVISIKTRDFSNAGLSAEALEKRIHQYDCHQTSLVAKMKTLYTMYVERQLGITLADDAVAGARNLGAFAQLVYEALREGEGQ